MTFLISYRTLHDVYILDYFQGAGNLSFNAVSGSSIQILASLAADHFIKVLEVEGNTLYTHTHTKFDSNSTPLLSIVFWNNKTIFIMYSIYYYSEFYYINIDINIL